MLEENAFCLVLAACAGRSGALGESVLGALKLVNVPLQLIDMALKNVHSLQVLGQLAAVLGQQLISSLVSALVLFLQLDYPGDLIECEAKGLELHDALEIDKVLGVVICKNLFLCNRQKTKFYLLMMPGDKKFKTKELSSQINSARLSFAEPEDMLKYLDIEPGAVSIMGLMNDRQHEVQLLIDEDVLKGEFLGCHPCVCTSSLRLRTQDVIERFLPAVGHTFITVQLKGED